MRPMNSASAPATVRVIDGYNVAAPAVGVTEDKVLVAEDVPDPVLDPALDPEFDPEFDPELDPVLVELLDPVLVELAGMLLSMPPSMVMPGRLVETLAARAV